MITEDYVSFEVAKLLKEKGFNEATNRYYNAQHDEIRTVSDIFMMHWNDEEYMKRLMMGGALAIPTLQMACKWLREYKKLVISIDLNYSDNSYSYLIESLVEHRIVGNGVEETYEEATEAAIKYTLENLI